MKAEGIYVFDANKKHSVLYKPALKMDDMMPFSSVYLMRSVMQGKVPKIIKVTVEEVKDDES